MSMGALWSAYSWLVIGDSLVWGWKIPIGIVVCVISQALIEISLNGLGILIQMLWKKIRK